MPANVVDAELAAADRAAIMDAIADISARLPFLVDLKKEQRRRLQKMGPASLQFVRDALTVAQQHEDILPRGFGVAEFERDLALTQDLDAILIRLNSLREHIDDTRLLVGSEAMSAALVVYKRARVTPHGQALDEAAALLGKRFKRRSSGGNGTDEGGDGQ